MLFISYLAERVIVLQSEFVEDQFIKIHADYVDTLHTIKALLYGRVNLVRLKEWIGRLYPYLKDEVERENTVDKVMSLFHEKHDTFPRLVELHGLMHSLELYEVEKKIDKFSDKRREVYKTILAKDFPKIEPETYNCSRNVQVGNNV